MIYPKLKPRPKSTNTCQRFAGLDRRPGASNRTQNKTWVMGWHDERNLSADQWPRMCVRKRRATTPSIDHNNPVDDIVAMAGGDHLVLLDKTGYLWCNGHKISLNPSDHPRTVFWAITHDDPPIHGQAVTISITPAKGTDETGAALGGLTATQHAKTVTFRIKYDDHEHGQVWETNATGRWRETDLEDDYGITFWADHDLYPGWSFYVNLTVVGAIVSGTMQIIRMGAYAVLASNGKLQTWANVVQLAAGETMTAGTDYGVVDGKALAYSGTSLTLTLCDIDGNAYSGVVVSATEPTQEGYWLDTSGSETTLREWSVSQSVWVQVTGTYIKIQGLDNEPFYDKIRKGDGASFAFDCANGTDAEVVKLLNSDHYLYDADMDDLSGGWVMIAGVLPSDSVTVTASGYITRSSPEFDFVTEAGNRLWACRYSEADGLNEIYASKLGDFRNWRVYQGLSTDSWTVSRGTAAPFTGAITLGGNPLFFREESLEKVFPSAAGAHQIATYSLDGVQKGSGGSMVIIDERLYYKSRMGVCVYSGTLPVSISDVFGDWQFGQASAARHRRKYAVCMTRSDGARLCMVYDTESGDWHAEDEVWDGIAGTWADELYYVRDGRIYQMDGGSDSSGVFWWAVTDDMSLELPEHKWVSRVRIRALLELGATCRVYLSHDDGPWMRKGTLHGNRLCSQEFDVWPRRCDHFRIKLEGTGGCIMQSISYQIERSQGGM